MKRSVDVINYEENFVYRKERNEDKRRNYKKYQSPKKDNNLSNYKMQDQRRDRVYKDKKEINYDEYFDRYELPGQWEYMTNYHEDIKAYQNYQKKFSSMKKLMTKNTTQITKKYEEKKAEKSKICDDEEEEGEIKDEPSESIRDEKNVSDKEEIKEKTLDLDSEFMVLDSIESDMSDSDVQEIVDSDDEIDENIGREYCNLVYYCQLCSSYLIGHSDKEKALLIHCRTKKHYENCKKAKKVEKMKKKNEDLNKLIKEHNQLRDEIRKKRK